MSSGPTPDDVGVDSDDVSAGSLTAERLGLASPAGFERDWVVGGIFEALTKLIPFAGHGAVTVSKRLL